MKGGTPDLKIQPVVKYNVALYVKSQKIRRCETASYPPLSLRMQQDAARIRCTKLCVQND